MHIANKHKLQWTFDIGWLDTKAPTQWSLALQCTYDTQVQTQNWTIYDKP
jgi:hypothetical protein